MVVSRYVVHVIQLTELRSDVSKVGPMVLEIILDIIFSCHGKEDERFFMYLNLYVAKSHPTYG